MIAVTSLTDFHRIYGRLYEQGRKPRWFMLNGIYYICNETIFREAIKKYS